MQIILFTTYIMNNMNNTIINQNYLLIFSFFYIYFLSDVFSVINGNIDYKLIFRLCIPMFGKLFVQIIKLLEKYNIDLHEWWHSTVSTELIVCYIFKFIHWIYNNNIHQCWDYVVKYGLDMFFILLVFKIIYNFVFLFNYSLMYITFSLLCLYGVYMRFETSKISLITISAKCVEMGTGIIISEQFKLIDEWKDYCIKNKNSWLSYSIKLILGYYKNTNIDGDKMADEIGEYIGVSSEECKNLYLKSVIKKVSNVVEVSKSVYGTISNKMDKFTSNNEDIKMEEIEKIEKIESLK